MSNAEKDMKRDREKDRPNVCDAVFVCRDCGIIWGKHEPEIMQIITIHMGSCDVCGAEGELRHVRHFGRLDPDTRF